MRAKHLPFLTITLGLAFLCIIIPDYLRQRSEQDGDLRMDGLELSLFYVWIIAPAAYFIGLLVYLIFFFRRRIRRTRRDLAIRLGRCVCGYDLRASPSVCPECGREVPFLLRQRRRILMETEHPR